MVIEEVQADMCVIYYILLLLYIYFFKSILEDV